MARKPSASIVGVVLTTALSPHTGLAQHRQVPTSPNLPAAQLQTQPFGQTQPLGQTQPQFQPGPGLQPIPGVMLGQPTFDPYSNNATAPVAPPALLGPPQVLAAPGLQGYPQQPPVLFPEGLLLGQAYPRQNSQGWDRAGIFDQAQPEPRLELFEDARRQHTGINSAADDISSTDTGFWNTRLQHTWINGESGANVEIYDSQVSSTMTFPTFGASQIGLQITPTFILHLWDGPSHGGFDLPPRAYSAFVDFALAPEITRQLSAELNVNVGVYTDFEHFSADSFSVRGVGLGVYQLTLHLTAKAGVEYYDRVDIKLLPAGGLFWRPNPHTNFEIYFPRPKLSQWLATLRNTEVWGYVGGEYGGGSWTIERTSGLDDRIDINDFRAFLGVEWGPPTLISEGWPSGFFEAGYVFEREVVYVSGGGFSPPDTFMLRGGLAY